MPIAIMPEYKHSILLNAEENDQIFSLLGPKCQTLATTVVELYATSGRDNDEWHKQETGVLCLVKDISRRSYFFRLFCPLRKQLLWEHEVYNNLEYLSLTPYLHSFEAEDCINAFNFANEEEGTQLKNVLLQKLEYKKQKRLGKKQKSQNNLLDTTGMGHSVRPAPQPNGVSSMGGSTSSLYNQSSKSSLAISKKDAKKKLTKADIGTPQNFRHVSHVGWDPNKGFDLDKVEDPQLKLFFEAAGVSENQLRDRDTREFIYDFINAHGGIEAVKETVEAPPVPVRARPPPPPPNRAPTMAPPPPPPPPPPVRTLPPRNVLGTGTNMVSIASEMPPPAPPIPSIPPPPPVSQPPEDGRSALLQEIQNGITLRPVSTESADSKRSSTTSSRGELLCQIRGGVELKPVTATNPQKQSQPNTPPPNSLAGALARALAERSKDIHGDSSGSSDDDDEEDDEEWEE